MTALIKHLQKIENEGIKMVLVACAENEAIAIAETLRENGFNALRYTEESIIVNF